jgi:hypothetical protein
MWYHKGHESAHCYPIHNRRRTTLLIWVSTRFSSALRNLPEGTLYPVQFNPSDPAFFVVSGAQAKSPAEPD